MKILVKSALILDKKSPYNKKRKDIYIKDGMILQIDNDLSMEAKVVEGKSLRVSPGWFDMRANFNDPGNEHKEDLYSGCQAAAGGGFTAVAILPNTKPSIHSKNDIIYIINKSKNCITDIYPLGSVTKENLGEELTEMIDQYYAGAIAFTDGEKPIWNTDILYKTLQYLKKTGSLLINMPEDRWLNMLGLMNEGPTSTKLGLKGMPRIAEEVMVERDLRILGYSGGRIHFSNISTAESVKLIRQAKKKGMQVSCDIAAHQIAFEESALEGFDTNLKVNPPLRERSDIKALITGLEDGTIDAVVSSHSPQDIESKRLEFDLAEYGMTGLQTVYPILNDVIGDLPEELIVDLLSFNPRSLLGLHAPVIREGEKANLTIYDNKATWVLDENTNLSKSANSPFWGKTLKGKVIGVINKNLVFLNP